MSINQGDLVDTLFYNIVNKKEETFMRVIESVLNNKDYLEKVYAIGAEKAERQARKTLRKVYKKIGLIERKFL